MMGPIKKNASKITDMISTTSIFQGVPPSKWPAFKSWIRDPETEQATQTTAATPSTAATPESPVTPMVSMTSAAMISAASVNPESGWLELPTNPTKYPPTAESRNPVTVMMTAATMAETIPW